MLAVDLTPEVSAAFDLMVAKLNVDRVAVGDPPLTRDEVFRIIVLEAIRKEE